MDQIKFTDDFKVKHNAVRFQAQYGMTGQQKGEVTNIEYLSQRGAGYNGVAMHAETICGMNVLTVRDAVRRARELLSAYRRIGVN